MTNPLTKRGLFWGVRYVVNPINCKSQSDMCDIWQAEIVLMWYSMYYIYLWKTYTKSAKINGIYFPNWCKYIRLTHLCMHIYLVRELLLSKKKNQECYCSKCVWIRGSYYCYFFLKKIVKSFEKEPWKSRILVPKKNIALRETFIIIRFPDVYDVDS